MRSIRLALACGAFTASCLMAAIAPSVSHAATPQQLDFQQGMRWNQLVHCKPDAVGGGDCFPPTLVRF